MFRPLWNFLKGLQLPIHFFPSKSSFEEINFLYIFLSLIQMHSFLGLLISSSFALFLRKCVVFQAHSKLTSQEQIPHKTMLLWENSNQCMKSHVGP